MLMPRSKCGIHLDKTGEVQGNNRSAELAARLGLCEQLVDDFLLHQGYLRDWLDGHNASRIRIDFGSPFA